MMSKSKKVKPELTSNQALMLQKLNAAAIRLGLPTIKISPQQLIGQINSLKNLQPMEQRQKFKDILMLKRYERQAPSFTQPKIAVQSSPLKMLKTMNKYFDLGDKNISNMVKNLQKLVVKVYKEMIITDAKKPYKPNYYQVLEVNPTADLKTITKAKDELLKHANEKQQEQINEAFQLLSNELDRLEYDQYLTEQVDEVDDLDDEQIIAEVLALSSPQTHELTPKEKAKKEEEFLLFMQTVLSIIMPNSEAPSPQNLKPSPKPSRQAEQSPEELLSPADRDLLALSQAVESMREKNQGISFGLGLLETFVDACRYSEGFYSIVKFFGGY